MSEKVEQTGTKLSPELAKLFPLLEAMVGCCGGSASVTCNVDGNDGCDQLHKKGLMGSTQSGNDWVVTDLPLKMGTTGCEDCIRYTG